MSGTLGAYSWLITADGSPSLKLGEEGEWMHSSGGAFAESRYIYAEAAEKALERGGKSFFSLGLGLGYNELLVMAEALSKDIAAEGIHITSFEADPFLSQSFLDWLRQSAEGGQAGHEPGVYDSMLKSFEAGYDPALCKKLPLALWGLYQSGGWKLLGALESTSQLERAYHCLLYDAFSSKSSPGLWSEEFLNDLLKRAAEKTCVFSTYACTGALKRALVANGFELHIRKGFHIKKQSTYAER